MLGAIAGDIIGSVYEASGFKSKVFPLFDRESRFTDDSVLTIAVARAILEGLDYDLARTVDEIRPAYRIDLSCQGTVPQAVVCFLESDSFEDAVRNAVSLGGDSDTLACIAGTIAHAFYGRLPAEIVAGVKRALDADLWSVTERFCARYGIEGC